MNNVMVFLECIISIVAVYLLCFEEIAGVFALISKPQTQHSMCTFCKMDDIVALKVIGFCYKNFIQKEFD